MPVVGDYQSLENGRNNSKPDSLARPSVRILRKLAGAYGISVPDRVWDVFQDDETVDRLIMRAPRPEC